MLSLPCATEAGRTGRERKSRCCDLHPNACSAPKPAVPLGMGPLCLDHFRGTLRPKFVPFAFPCHLFIRGKMRVAGCKLSLLELCQVQSPILIFSLFFPQHFQNSYLWRPCMVSMVQVVDLSSRVTIIQVQTISCVLTASLARCRRHWRPFLMI